MGISASARAHQRALGALIAVIGSREITAGVEPAHRNGKVATLTVGLSHDVSSLLGIGPPSLAAARTLRSRSSGRRMRDHTNCAWVLLYIERWLKAAVQMEDGGVVPRTAGTPQGGSSARSLQTCSCTMRSTRGCRETIRTFGSRGTRTMPFVTARAPQRLGRWLVIKVANLALRLQ